MRKVRDIRAAFRKNICVFRNTLRCGVLSVFKYINKSLKILIKQNVIHLFLKIDSLGIGLVWETVNEVKNRKIPSPDRSGKPMPVENYFFLVVAERPTEAPDSG